MERDNAKGKILITGATGFVGRHLRVALEALACPLRLGTRRPQAQHDAAEWVYLDPQHPESFLPALSGCQSAYYLMHQLGDPGDYAAREARSARAFAEAAAQAGVARLVYLGGVVPASAPSVHLRSRQRTGEILRAGAVPTVEIRAAMIVGHGSMSWRIVRDLAARLPAMILPRWLRYHSWPVALDDVLLALIVAREIPDAAVGCYDLPGPQRISHQDILRLTAARFGKHPVMIDVPVLTPRLSSYWIRLVTDVDLKLAKELVYGLTADLDPTQPLFWTKMAGRSPLTLAQAITHALADELRDGPLSPATRRRIAALATAASTMEHDGAGA